MNQAGEVTAATSAASSDSDIATTAVAIECTPGSAGANGNLKETTAPATLPRRLPFQVGLTVGGYFDDNIYIQSNGADKQSDFIWSIAPLVAWNSAGQTGATNSVQLVYTPTIVIYQDHGHLDTVDQAAGVTYGYTDGRVDLVVAQQYSAFQENDADVGHIVRETQATTAVRLNYQLASKTSLDISAHQDYTESHPGYRSIQWTLAPYFDYQIAPKTVIGLGTVLGAVDLDGPNQEFAQVNGRVGYNPDAKLSFSGDFGAEFRATEGHGSVPATPSFDLGLSYEPFGATDLGLNAYRRYEYSGRFFGEDYLATGASAFVSQQFFQRFRFILSGSFENASYRDNFSATYIEQNYDYLATRPEVSYSPITGLTLRVYYQYRRNLAQGAVGNFSDNQAGFTAEFIY